MKKQDQAQYSERRRAAGWNSRHERKALAHVFRKRVKQLLKRPIEND